MAKRESYMERYYRTLAAANRVEQTAKDIQDEQDRIAYLDSLIATERQTLIAAQKLFETSANFTEANKALAEQMALEDIAGQITASAGERAAASKRLSTQEKQALSASLLQGTTYSVAEGLLRAKPGAAREILSALVRTSDRSGLTSTEIEELRGVGESAAARARPTGGLTTAERQRLSDAEAATLSAQKAAFFAGPQGTRGGEAGLREQRIRKMTAAQLREAGFEDRAKALDESEFATEEDAFNAALTVIRTTGDPMSIDDDLARTVYERARSLQAYRNDQTGDFEQEVLDARKRVFALEAEREKLAGAYDDPRQEAIRRELRARGYKVEDPYVLVDGKYERNPEAWRNAYVRYQDTPEYDYYIGAQERVNKAREEEKVITPSSRAEQVAVRYTVMRSGQGQSTTPADLAAQLEKAGFKGKELDDAVSFTMAYWSLGGEEQSEERIKAQKEQKAREMAEQDRMAELAYARGGEARQAEAEAARLAREASRIEVSEIGRDRRGIREFKRQERLTGKERLRSYQQLRAMGFTEDEARAQVYGTPEPEPTFEPPLNAEFVPLPGFVQEMADREAAEAQAVQSVAPTQGQVGFEFVDETDPAKTRYRRTGPKTFEVLTGASAGMTIEPSTGFGQEPFMALQAAEQGAFDTVRSIQQAQAERRRKAAPPAPPAAPATPAPEPAPAKVETDAEREARLLRELGG